MPHYRVVAIEYYAYQNTYHGVEAATPLEAVEICKGEAEDETEFCEYVGWHETVSVEQLPVQEETNA